MAKKQFKNHKPSKRWESYKVEGDSVKRLKITCPKCGPAMFMAVHKNRKTCGKCGYTEFSSKKTE